MDAVGEDERVAIKVLNVRKLAVPIYPLMRKKLYAIKSVLSHQSAPITQQSSPRVRGGGGWLLWLMFAGYVPLASQSPCPSIVYFLANYRPHPSHFLENVIFAIPT